MIEITNSTESDYPNAFAKAEREKPWTTRKSANEWRVVPRKLRDGSREHGKYIVRFVKWGNKVFADCVNVLTGERCLGHAHKGVCYHIASVLIRVRREESKRAA